MMGWAGGKRTIGWMLLGIYAFVFSLGDALHGLPGCGHHGHLHPAVDCSQTVATTDRHDHADDHRSGCSGHDHSSAKEARAISSSSRCDEDGKEPHLDASTEEDCSICRLLAAPVVPTTKSVLAEAQLVVGRIPSYRSVSLNRIPGGCSVRGPPATL
jgi:hypothetical protein